MWQDRAPSRNIAASIRRLSQFYPNNSIAQPEISKRSTKNIWSFEPWRTDTIEDRLEKVDLTTCMSLTLQKYHQTYDANACKEKVRCKLWQKQHDKTNSQIGFKYSPICFADENYDTTQQNPLQFSCQ